MLVQVANTTLIERIRATWQTNSAAFQRISTDLLASPAEFMYKSMQEIASASRVSEPTVLRYCRHFGYKGIPDFRIALAMSLVEISKPKLSADNFIEPQLDDKALVHRGAKIAIAQEAIKLLGADRSLLLDSGSTTAAFAHELLGAQALSILTTGLNIINILAQARQHTLMLPAGVLRYESKSLGGRMVENSLQSMRFDTGFFGADSIDIALGISTFNEAEAHQSAAMMATCKRVVVLADSSKFTSPSLHRICTLDRIDTIVTDSGLDESLAQAIASRGTRVLSVKAAAF